MALVSLTNGMMAAACRAAEDAANARFYFIVAMLTAIIAGAVELLVVLDKKAACRSQAASDTEGGRE